jgi:hypothetical protein
MMRWVVVVVLVLVAVAVATRGMSRTVRAAADWEFGRRFMWLVKLWPLWRLLIALSLAFLAVLIVVADQSKTPTGPTPVPVQVTPDHYADLPGWTRAVVVALIVVALLGAVAVMAVSWRSRSGRWELDAYLDDDPDDDPPPPWDPDTDGAYLTDLTDEDPWHDPEPAYLTDDGEEAGDGPAGGEEPRPHGPARRRRRVSRRP